MFLGHSATKVCCGILIGKFASLSTLESFKVCAKIFFVFERGVDAGPIDAGVFPIDIDAVQIITADGVKTGIDESAAP